MAAFGPGKRILPKLGANLASVEQNHRHFCADMPRCASVRFDFYLGTPRAHIDDCAVIFVTRECFAAAFCHIMRAVNHGSP